MRPSLNLKHSLHTSCRYGNPKKKKKKKDMNILKFGNTLDKAIGNVTF